MAKRKSMRDQFMFLLECRHEVVLGRLDERNTWTCEECGHGTDLRTVSARSELEHLRDRAMQIDLQEQEKGNTIVRAKDF